MFAGYDRKISSLPSQPTFNNSVEAPFIYRVQLSYIRGFYQIFVKNTKYDNRYLLVNKEGKTFDLAYSKYGLPDIIDGTTRVPSPQDMHFWKPDTICGKSVAFVGSLVTY